MSETYRSILPVEAIQIRETADDSYVADVHSFFDEHHLEDWEGDDAGIIFCDALGDWRHVFNGEWLVWFSGAREPVVMTDSAFSLNFRKDRP